MLSGIYWLTSRVLKRIEDGEDRKIQAILNDKYRLHSKDRNNGYIAIMALIGDELIKQFNSGLTIDALLEAWIEGQNDLAAVNEVDTNPIVQLLEALTFDYLLDLERHLTQSQATSSLQSFICQYPVEVKIGGKKIILKGSARQFAQAFSMVAKKKGLANPYNSSHKLGARLSDSKTTIREAGWELTIVPLSSRGKEYEFIHEYSESDRYLKVFSRVFTEANTMDNNEFEEF